MSPIATYQDILTAVEFNDAMRIRQGKFYCGQAYYGYDPDNQVLIQPGEHRISVNRKYDDISAALVIGGIACTSTLNGFDAIRPENGKLVSIELKNSVKERSQFWCGPQLGVYSGQSYQSKTAIGSDFSACYELVNNLSSKRVPTYLILRDNKTNEVIDCRWMDANTIHSVLETKVQLAQAKADAKNKKMTTSKFDVKWSEFERHGTVVKTREAAIGYENYKEQIIEPYRLGLIPTMPT